MRSSGGCLSETHRRQVTQLAYELLTAVVFSTLNEADPSFRKEINSCRLEIGQDLAVDQEAVRERAVLAGREAVEPAEQRASFLSPYARTWRREDGRRFLFQVLIGP